MLRGGTEKAFKDHIAFQGDRHSLNFIKVEISARIQITSTENTPIRGQETQLPVSVMSPTV